MSMAGPADNRGITGVPSHFRIRTRFLPKDMGYVLQSTEDDFVYDVVDADVRIEINGRTPFLPGSYRLSDDGYLRSIPVIDFAWNLVVACKHLSNSNPSTERVTVTSTHYELEFERQNDSVQLRVLEGGRAGKVIAATSLTLIELQRECKSVGELELAGIFRDNPALRGNPHLKRFASEIAMLERAIKQ